MLTIFPLVDRARRRDGFERMTIGTVSSVAPPGRKVLAISFIARSGLKMCSKTSCVTTRSN